MWRKNSSRNAIWRTTPLAKQVLPDAIPAFALREEVAETRSGIFYYAGYARQSYWYRMIGGSNVAMSTFCLY